MRSTVARDVPKVDQVVDERGLHLHRGMALAVEVDLVRRDPAQPLLHVGDPDDGLRAAVFDAHGQAIRQFLGAEVATVAILESDVAHALDRDRAQAFRDTDESDAADLACARRRAGRIVGSNSADSRAGRPTSWPSKRSLFVSYTTTAARGSANAQLVASATVVTHSSTSFDIEHPLRSSDITESEPKLHPAREHRKSWPQCMQLRRNERSRQRAPVRSSATGPRVPSNGRFQAREAVPRRARSTPR